MAERRMFSKKITNSDAFLDMPLSAQALYFHLSMNADDDGFVNNPKSITRLVGAREDDFKVLITKSFLISFETGVVVVRHWLINNYIRSDRYQETQCQEEFKKLQKINEVYQMDTECLPSGSRLVYQMDTQVSIGKDSIDKVNIKEKDISKDISKKKSFIVPTLEEVQAYCEERNNNVDAEKFVDFYTANGWKVGKNPMKDWKASVRTWEKSNKTIPKKPYNSKFDREDDL